MDPVQHSLCKMWLFRAVAKLFIDISVKLLHNHWGATIKTSLTQSTQVEAGIQVGIK